MSQASLGFWFSSILCGPWNGLNISQARLAIQASWMLAAACVKSFFFFGLSAAFGI
jgi:hypothetical protein